jgi:hypothetical protein
MPDFYTSLTQNSRCTGNVQADIAGRDFYQTLAQDGKVSTDNGANFYVTLTRDDCRINPLN